MSPFQKTLLSFAVIAIVGSYIATAIVDEVNTNYVAAVTASSLDGRPLPVFRPMIRRDIEMMASSSMASSTRPASTTRMMEGKLKLTLTSIRIYSIDGDKRVKIAEYSASSTKPRLQICGVVGTVERCSPFEAK